MKVVGIIATAALAADPLQLRRVNAGKPDRRVDHPGQHTKERSA